MLKYITKLSQHFVILFIIIGAVFVNWYWPLYLWLGDTAVYRFIWLSIFFILLDIFIEIITRSTHELKLMTEKMSFSREMRKISKGFKLMSKVSLPNKLKAEYVVVGSSGIWLVDVQDDGGDVVFNGDELVQKDVVLKGLITHLIEKSFVLADLIKKNLNRDFKVSPVIVFSSSGAKLDGVPKNIRGVFISAGKDAVSLIENTDVQLIDQNTSEAIYNLITKPAN